MREPRGDAYISENISERGEDDYIVGIRRLGLSSCVATIVPAEIKI